MKYENGNEIIEINSEEIIRTYALVAITIG